jgi:formylglycine-generating enzyme required for sulfatase activity
VTALLASAWAAGLGSCSGDTPPLTRTEAEVCLTNREGVRFCIDTYEASRDDATSSEQGKSTAAPHSFSDVMPWTFVGWDGARMACAARRKRLCEADEWVDACKGVVGAMGGTRYTYGDQRSETICNVGGRSVEPTGTSTACKSAFGTFDQSGNVAEWTGNAAPDAAARGGSFRSSQAHGCMDTSLAIALTDTSTEVGFRCCRTQQ